MHSLLSQNVLILLVNNIYINIYIGILGNFGTKNQTKKIDQFYQDF